MQGFKTETTTKQKQNKWVYKNKPSRYT